MALPILCLDVDGVLHSYESGWQGADVITDAPVRGAMEFIEAAADYFQVHIFSSRSNQEGGLAGMDSWLHDHLIEALGVERYKAIGSGIILDTVKPPSVRWLKDWAGVPLGWI